MQTIDAVSTCSKTFKILTLITFIYSLLLPMLSAYEVEPVYSKNGMVASTSEIASRVGVKILKAGGNAVDAAIAVGFALAAVYPSAGNVGGGGFMLIRTAHDGKVYALDYRETAPVKADRDMYLALDGKVNEDKIRFGPLSCGVPGTVRGFEEAHKRFGTMDWKQLIKPAIQYAKEGFPLPHRTARSLNKYKDYFLLYHSSQRIFVSGSKPGWECGDLLVQRDLARTLKRIAEIGPGEFYKGETARLLAKAMSEAGGIMTMEDLASYRPVWRKPLKLKFMGYKIYSMPPPSSGGVALMQILKLLSRQDLTKIEFGSADYIHLLGEVMKRAFKDRALYLGDPDFVDVPIKRLLNDKYIEEISSSISMSRAVTSKSLAPNAFAWNESEETTHYTVVDKWGNVVSNTYTLNSGFGSKFVAGETGILMNNEMDDFSAKPGAPNIYGLVGTEANAIAPRKRMLSSMTPTIITKDGEFFLALGSPGGPTIISSVAQVTLNVLLFGMNLQEAINAPRIHHQWLPDKLRLEIRGFAPEVLSILRKRGHTLELKSYIGDVQAIMRLKDINLLAGGSDPRLEGKAVGY